MKNTNKIEIHGQARSEDKYVDAPGSTSRVTGNARKMKIFGQVEAIPTGSITDREEPANVADEDFDPQTTVDRARTSGPGISIFNTSGDVA